MKTFLDVHYWCSFLTDATLLLILLVWLWVWLPPLVIRSRRLPKGALGMAFLNFIWIHENLGPRTSPEYQNVYRHEYVHMPLFAVGMRPVSWGVVFLALHRKASELRSGMAE